MKFNDKVRDLIRTRSRDKCEICGATCLFGQIHHRRPRGMGGSKDPSCGSPANGIWVHAMCHHNIESRRKEALDYGWLVRQGVDPSSVPFKRWAGWVLLQDDGTMRHLPNHASPVPRPSPPAASA